LTGISVERPKLLKPDEAGRALAAFRASCPALLSRDDVSGLTRANDWRPLCDEARSLDPVHAAGFFFHRFDWVRVGDGRAFATGYYEPEIEGSRVPLPGYTPIHGLPSDLVRCTRADGTAGRGRVDASGNCVSYHSRSDIEAGALNGRGLEIAWAKDPVELFFLEIQGSGRVRMPDGSVMRIGYAGQNGREYVAVGKLLRDRGIFQPGQATMQSIKDWIRANPEEGRALMRENLSYIFFRELTGPGPLGALGVAVTPMGTVAADPKFVPLGAPVHLTLDRADASGLWVAQDTGGAIKGANRFDTFWGAGEQAVASAGGLASPGTALLLLPKTAVARALARP
jgi:membrane-bound lytic murein transglycosylase A